MERKNILRGEKVQLTALQPDDAPHIVELNLHRVCLTVFSYNQAARTLYERLGFQHEGLYREQTMRDGQRHDMLLYGLLRREWQELHEHKQD